MPGLYINDGGQTSSALAGAIARMADNFSPKTQAEAEEMRQRIESERWDNRLKSSQVPALENSALGVPAIVGTAGSETVSPLAKTSGALAQPAVSVGGAGSAYQGNTQSNSDTDIAPENRRGVVDTTNMSPISRLGVAAILSGKGADELQKILNLGREVGGRPTLDTEQELYRQRHLPITMHPNERWVGDPGSLSNQPVQPASPAPAAGGGAASYPDPGQPAQGGGVAPAPSSPTPAPSPTPGVAPAPGGLTAGGGVIQGPSAVVPAAESQFGADAAKEFAAAASTGQEAGQQIDKLKDILGLYHNIVERGGISLQDAQTRQLVQAAMQRLGLPQMDLTQTDQIKTVLDAQLLQMMGGMRSKTGQVGSMSDRDMEILRKTIADPSRSSAVFLGVANAMMKDLSQRKEAGDLALSYNPAMEAQQIQQLRAGIGQRLSNPDAGAEVKAMFPDLGWDMTQPGGGVAGVKPPPPVGTVEQGYRFMGGNPADPRSWQQVQ